MIEPDPPDLIVVSYYEGAYGPTLRFDLGSHGQLDRLRNVFRSLAAGLVRRTEFAELTDAQYDGLSHLVLAVVGDASTSKVLKRVASASGSWFVWSLSNEGWAHCADVLNGFAHARGHHYLTDEGRDDALVEVAFLERLAS